MPNLFVVRLNAPRVPGRRVLVCASGRVARLAAGDTAAGSDVWQNFGRGNARRGLLLVRWRGLDLDYGADFRPSVLPDGTLSGFRHRGDPEPWSLLKGATWWCERTCAPPWLRKLGVLTCGPFGTDPDEGVRDAIRKDEAASYAKATGHRPFGFRAVPGWRDLAASPGASQGLLPGMELLRA